MLGAPSTDAVDMAEARALSSWLTNGVRSTTAITLTRSTPGRAPIGRNKSTRIVRTRRRPSTLWIFSFPRPPSRTRTRVEERATDNRAIAPDATSQRRDHTQRRRMPSASETPAGAPSCQTPRQIQHDPTHATRKALLFPAFREIWRAATIGSFAGPSPDIGRSATPTRKHRRASRRCSSLPPLPHAASQPQAPGALVSLQQ